MPYDYSQLFTGENALTNTWLDIYDESQALPQNLLNILKRTVLLPHDFYELAAVYFLLPSALCRTIPYLFLFGQSGSGKSITAKLASYLHGIDINSSSDTFAGIRNSLDKRRYGWVEVPFEEKGKRTWNKYVEVNTCMVWDDIDASIFTNSPDLYRLFKFGYDRSTDKITISSKEIGQNLEFHCFCPKIFSSISPLHLDSRFQELKRRLIVISFKRVEELSNERLSQLGITKDDYHTKLIDIDTYDWKGFNREFKEFWDLSMAGIFVNVRTELSKTVRGLTSQQRAISLDLMACGIATGIWNDETEAVGKLKAYWSWFKQETETNAGLSQLLSEYIKTESKNADKAKTDLMISSVRLRSQVDMWVAQAWLYERPKAKSINEIMLDLGMRLQKGIWRKG